MSGLCFQVAGWDLVTLAVNVPPYGSNTWTGSAQIASGNASAVEALDDMVEWANDAGRPWAGNATFSWSVVPGGVGPGDAFVGFSLTSGVAGTGWTAAAGLFALLGWTSTTALFIVSGASGQTKGTVLGPVAVADPHRHQPDTGPRSPSGAFVRRHRGVVPVAMEMVLDEAGVYALTEAIEDAVSPTRAHVYSEAQAAWLSLAGVAAFSRPSRGFELYRQAIAGWEDR